MLKDSLAHVDTAASRCFKPPQPPEDMQTAHVYTEWDVTDKLTLIWTCSGFLDMTSYYCETRGWPWGQRAGSAPSGRHVDLAEGATSFGQGEKSAPLTLLWSAFYHPEAQVTWPLCDRGPLSTTFTKNPLPEKTVFLYLPLWCKWVESLFWGRNSKSIVGAILIPFCLA